MPSVNTFLGNIGLRSNVADTRPASRSSRKTLLESTVSKLRSATGTVVLSESEVKRLLSLLEADSPFINGEINLEELESVGLKPEMTRRTVDRSRMDYSGDDNKAQSRELYDTFDALIAPNCTPNTSSAIANEDIPEDISKGQEQPPKQPQGYEYQPRREQPPSQPRRELPPVVESVVSAVRSARAKKEKRAPNRPRGAADQPASAAAALGALGGGSDEGDGLLEMAMAAASR